MNQDHRAGGQEQVPVDLTRLPRHIAIVMDGNGRWARQRGLPRVAGHRAGVKVVRDIVRASGELGLEVLTLFAFSTENWLRPRAEVSALVRLLITTIRNEIAEINRSNVKILVIGRWDEFPASARREVAEAIAQTANNTGLRLTLALNYGGRREIVEAAKRLAQDLLDGKHQLSEVDDALFASYLDTAGLPDPDLLIRTSGEMRISNFLLYQLAYTEMCVTPILWPDFRREHFYAAIRDYQQRERRFGRTSAQVRMAVTDR